MKRRTRQNVGQWPNMRAFTHKAIVEELIRARKKHPHRGAHIQLLENYVAELRSAIEQNHLGRQSAAQIFACGIAVAAMAIRTLEEGTSGFKYAEQTQTFELTGE